MNNEVLRQVLLVIVLPAMASTVLTFVACHTILTVIRRRRPDNRAPHWGDEWVWIGDLSGFSIDSDSSVSLFHRCGWVRILPPGEYLGNIVADEAMRHRDEGCIEYAPRYTVGTAAIPPGRRRAQ